MQPVSKLSFLYTHTMSAPQSDATPNTNTDPMIAAYFLIIYFSIYTVLGFGCSFFAEYQRSKNNRYQKYCNGWSVSMHHSLQYYISFALHVMDESTSLSALISMYCICEELYGTDVNDWKVITRQSKPILMSSHVKAKL